MNVRFLVTASLFLIATALAAQPQVAYIIPDIGTPGMNTYVEIMAPVTAQGTYGAEGMGSPTTITIEFVTPSDSNFIVISPVVVSWEGRLISCQFFVKPYAPLRPYPFYVRLNNDKSNVDTFFVQAPQKFGNKSGNGIIGSGGSWGTRSKRGAMIVDSMILGAGTYTIETVSDPDPFTPGNQGYLPAIILSKGNVQVNPSAVLSAGANGKNGGPGGGGGGGYGSGVPPIVPGEKDTPLGSGFTGGKSNIPIISSPASSFGTGSGASSRSLNGVEANNQFTTAFPTLVRLYGAGPGHPFDSDGRSGGATAATGGTGINTFGSFFGGGGNSSPGGGLPGAQGDINGQIIGNKEVIPLHGGGGGSSGATSDSVGAGGGGGLAIYSQQRMVIPNVQANGANGANGCNGCGIGSGDASGGGAGGSIIVGGKLGVTLGTVQAEGGRAGATQPSAPITSTSGSGGTGRFRHDGRKESGGLAVTAGASIFTGPTLDTLTIATQPIFTVKGTGQYLAGKQTNIQVFVRGENLQWNYNSPYNAVVQPDSTWQVEVAITTTDSLLYIFAVQLTDPNERNATTPWTRIPNHVFSQAAANIVRYRPAPNLSAPSKFRMDTILCPEIIFDTIIIRNVGAGRLQIDDITYPAPFHISVKSPVTFPRFVEPGEFDTIIVRFDGSAAPYGLTTAEIEIISNDVGPNKSPWKIEATAFKVRYEYIDPDPNNPPTVDFGEVAVGSSIDRKAVVHNVGTLVATDILIDSLWVSPPTPSIVTISRSIPKNTAIKPGDSLVIELRYSPTVEESLGTVFLCARIVQPCLDTICWPLTGKGVRSALTVSKGSLSMNIPACSPQLDMDDTVFISNTGSATINILELLSSPASIFNVVSPTVPPTLSLPPGARQEVIVRYTPGPNVRNSGSLLIVTDDPAIDTLNLDITGTHDKSAIEISAHNISLLSSCPGVQIDSTITISNTGSVEETVNFDFVGSGFPFQISPPPPYIIFPGEEVTVTFSFTPTIQGIIAAFLYVEGEPCGLRDTIAVEGGLVPANYSVQPQPLAFGDIRTGSLTQRVATIDNSLGLVGIRVASARIVPPTPELTISPAQAFPISIAAGGSDVVSLDYRPTGLGELPPGTRLEIIIDFPCPDTIWTEVTGRGINGVLIANPSPLDFGGVYSCLTETDTVWIQNSSPAPITILGIQVNSTPGEFTAVLADPSNPTPQLGPNESLAIVVSFTPNTPPDGAKNATLEILTNDPDVGTFPVPLRGFRLSESLSFTGPNFAPTFAGGQDVQRHFIVNDGSSPIAINNLQVNPPFKIVRTLPPLSALLLPGDTLIVDLEFAPTLEGTFEDSIDVIGLTICGPLRLPISAVSPATFIADAYWEDITGKPRELVLLPLKLTANLVGAEVKDYTVDASFNSTMLLPRRVVLDGTLSQGWAVSGVQIDTGFVAFRATGTAPLADTGTLAYVEMLVLLGNDIATPIESSDQSRFLSGGARLAIAPGLFTLNGYCAVGGNRLVRVTNNFGIKVVAPNPAREKIAVDFELVEDGHTRLALYDMLGRRVAVLIDQEMSAQPYHLEVPIDLPDGPYFLELTTPTQRDEVGVIVGE